MLVKFPFVDLELETLQKKIAGAECSSLTTLKNYKRKIVHLRRQIDQNYDVTKAKLLKKLSGRVHHLIFQHTIIEIAEEAQSLVENQQKKSIAELHILAKKLRKKIKDIIKKHRPSKNNAKMLRFASLCLDKVTRQEPFIDLTPAKIAKFPHHGPLPLMEDFEEAENLYELAHMLYENDPEKFFHFLNTFSPATKKEILFHALECGGSLQRNAMETKAQRMRTIRGILGFAHKLTHYYFDVTYYPTNAEVHATFKDLASILQDAAH